MTEMNRVETGTATKKAYKKPCLQELGAIKHTTRGSGTVNGDGGLGMMQAM